MDDSTIKLNDGRKLGFVDCGAPDGIPIIMLHGTPGSRIFGFENEPFVHDEGLRLITPERPGYGLSDPCKDRTMVSYADDIEQLADHLGIARFHVAGASGGGPYTLACAYRLPERVESATLIASATPMDMKDFFKGMSTGNKLAFRISQYAPFLLKPLYAFSSRTLLKYPEKLLEGIEPQLCPWDREVLQSLSPEEMEVFVSHIREAYRQGIEGAYSDTVLLSKPWGFDVASITVPIFLWHGESDTLMPVSPARQFASLLPNCESNFLEGAGHLLLESEEISRRILGRILEMNLEARPRRA